MQFILSPFNIRVWSLFCSACVCIRGWGGSWWQQRSEVGTIAFLLALQLNVMKATNRVRGAASVLRLHGRELRRGVVVPWKRFLNPCSNFIKLIVLVSAALGVLSSWCVSLSERCKVSGVRTSLEHLHPFRHSCLSNWTLSWRIVNKIRWLWK